MPAPFVDVDLPYMPVVALMGKDFIMSVLKRLPMLIGHYLSLLFDGCRGNDLPEIRHRAGWLDALIYHYDIV